MSRWFAMVVAFWGLAIASGFGALYAYGAGTGAAGTSPRRLPAASPIEPDPARWTVLVFAHARCPCTRATIAEFARLHAVHRDALNPVVVVYRPEDEPEPWANGAITEGARRVPGTRIVHDPGGVTARRFGVRTSGHVLAYRPDARLAFSGGLTNSRGHEGKSAGRSRLDALLRDADARGAASFEVFGCPIIDGDAPEACDESGCTP